MSGAYRDDWNAAVERVQALERELAEAQGGRFDDARRIAQLEGALAEARRLASIHAPLPPPPPPLPSNATSVLVLGILSIAFCGLMGPFAWNGGNRELQRIEAGLADPTRIGTVQAGRILGIVATVLMGFAFTIVLLGAMAS